METVKLSIVVDKELHQKLVAWAKREHRSLHGQLLAIVQRAVEAEEAASVAAPVGL